MQYHKKNGVSTYFFKFLFLIFPFLVWCIFVFAMDTPYVAIATLISAFIHELGHEVAFLLIKKKSSLPRPRLFGFGIYYVRDNISYKEEIFLAVMGPLFNLIGIVIGGLVLGFGTDACEIFTVVNVATCISNLLPVKGYDGHKIAVCTARLFTSSDTPIRAIDGFSYFLITVLCFISLYLIGKIGEGFWIFFVFFSSLLSCTAKSIRESNICE